MKECLMKAGVRARGIWRSLGARFGRLAHPFSQSSGYLRRAGECAIAGTIKKSRRWFRQRESTFAKQWFNFL
ncbi:hypothetical protein [Burkholderia sp. TSV86]|uniref:hypothetical protein n=1 Tax=Burkholderia sp. TSV86 TaxID=1385594 RepID=UPI0012E34880|nr:hypothetical protein [Burkholderia sp. TSV86]